jgi:octaprenyl-diphosphate synthase
MVAAQLYWEKGERMTGTVFAALEKELAMVHRRIAGELKLKAGKVSELIPLEFSLQEQYLVPSLVILAARSCGKVDHRVIIMAAGMEMMYLAQQIHNRIGEDDRFTPGLLEAELQLPVLIGDYIYGKFLVYTCEAGCLEFLPILSETVCQMNEGGVIRKETLESGRGSTLTALQAIKKETAQLVAEACHIGAALGGAAPELAAVWHEFGLQLGMAIGCRRSRLEPGLVDNYLWGAKKQLHLLSPGPDRDLLEQLSSQAAGAGEHQAKIPPPPERVTGNLAMAHY